MTLQIEISLVGVCDILVDYESSKYISRFVFDAGDGVRQGSNKTRKMSLWPRSLEKSHMVSNITVGHSLNVNL